MPCLKEEHGDCLVPSEYEGLVNGYTYLHNIEAYQLLMTRWSTNAAASSIRLDLYEEFRNEVESTRQERLESIGFVWQVKLPRVAKQQNVTLLYRSK
jgi:hypothetical protein